MLDRCLKETLRLRPPIMTMMRMARTPQVRTLFEANFTAAAQARSEVSQLAEGNTSEQFAGREES